MAISNGYCTLAELKSRFDILDATDDTILEQTIEAASRTVDTLCSRRFYAATETRYYTADDPDLLWVDDIASVTTLKTDEDADGSFETTWGPTDFQLDPPNASGDGLPYTRIYIAPTSPYAFPVYQRRGVQIVGSFGWPSVPHAVREATLLLAARYFKRKDAPMGAQIGNPEQGALSIPGKDPDVDRLLMGYRRFALVGV